MYALCNVCLCLAFSAADIEFHCKSVITNFIRPTAPLSRLETGFEKPSVGFLNPKNLQNPFFQLLGFSIFCQFCTDHI